MRAILDPPYCNKTKGCIRFLQEVANTHARASSRKGERTNKLFLTHIDYACMKAAAREP